MNRTKDLKRAMTHMIVAANASPPVEISVLDYNSADGLGKFIDSIHESNILRGGSHITYHRYEGRTHYHIAHAWNLAVKSSSGYYVTIMGADAIPASNYVVEVRKKISDGCVWMRCKNYKGILVIERSEFIAAGGYDERFEFYGGEDKEFEARIIRRGNSPCILPTGVVKTLRTSNVDKINNYRLNLSKRQMMTIGRKIRDENNAAGLLIANEGREWGRGHDNCSHY